MQLRNIWVYQVDVENKQIRCSPPDTVLYDSKEWQLRTLQPNGIAVLAAAKHTFIINSQHGASWDVVTTNAATTTGESKKDLWNYANVNIVKGCNETY